MSEKPNEELINSQIAELAGEYPGLSLSGFNEDHGWIVTGNLLFSARHDGIELRDEFQIKLYISIDYPEMLPVVEEIGGRIPSDFHKNSDTSLCLAPPEEAKLKFLEEPTLNGFVKNVIIPYFYSFIYLKKYNKMPYGDRSHGVEGLIEFYYEYFETQEIEVVLSLLCILADDSYKEKNYCPCGSGLKQKKCHGHELLSIKELFQQEYYIKVYDNILNYYWEINKSFPRMICIRKERMKEIQNLTKKRKRKRKKK